MSSLFDRVFLILPHAFDICMFMRVTYKKAVSRFSLLQSTTGHRPRQIRARYPDFHTPHPATAVNLT